MRLLLLLKVVQYEIMEVTYSLCVHILGFNFNAIVLKREWVREQIRGSFMFETWHLWLEIDSLGIESYSSTNSWNPFHFFSDNNNHITSRETQIIFLLILQPFLCWWSLTYIKALVVVQKKRKIFIKKQGDCHEEFKRDKFKAFLFHG